MEGRGQGLGARAARIDILVPLKLEVVRRAGLEPARPCEPQILSLMRLPISPPARQSNDTGARKSCVIGCRIAQQFSITRARPGLAVQRLAPKPRLNQRFRRSRVAKK